MPTARERRTNEDYNIVARRKPGVAWSTAQAELDALTARLRRDHPKFYPPNGGLTFSAVPLAEQVSGRARTPVMMLLGAVANAISETGMLAYLLRTIRYALVAFAALGLWPLICQRIGLMEKAA